MTDGALRRRLGANLRVHRLSLGLSQEQFGHLMGYDRTYIGALERGERNLRMDTFERIAQEIGRDPLELLVSIDTSDHEMIAVKADGVRRSSAREPKPAVRQGVKDKAVPRATRGRRSADESPHQPTRRSGRS